MRTATVIINLHALRSNLQKLRKLAPYSKFIAVVKANAYGHGLLKIAQSLYDVDAFGVARLEEALILYKGGITQPIILLEGFISYEDLLIISDYQFQTTVHNIEQIEALENIKLNNPIIVWMKIDIGMHRLGFRLEQAELFYHRLIRCKNIQKPINIVSHFSHTYEKKFSILEEQLDKFNVFCKNKNGFRSIASSIGILFYPKSHFEFVRPGIILYGVSPLSKKPLASDFGFQPVMSLISILIAVREHKIGEPVGYEGTWISKRDTRIGVIAIGYGDGYPYAAPLGTPVLINNREVKIVGRVTMDMVCVDLGPHAEDKVGDSVMLWGDKLPVERIAKTVGVSAYELITRLTSRVPTCYLDQSNSFLTL